VIGLDVEVRLRLNAEVWEEWKRLFDIYLGEVGICCGVLNDF
jgi:hypothetical protein